MFAESQNCREITKVTKDPDGKGSFFYFQAHQFTKKSVSGKNRIFWGDGHCPSTRGSKKIQLPLPPAKS
jgi:hypothetical protein